MRSIAQPWHVSIRRPVDCSNTDAALPIQPWFTNSLLRPNSSQLPSVQRCLSDQINSTEYCSTIRKSVQYEASREKRRENLLSKKQWLSDRIDLQFIIRKFPLFDLGLSGALYLVCCTCERIRCLYLFDVFMVTHTNGCWPNVLMVRALHYWLPRLLFSVVVSGVWGMGNKCVIHREGRRRGFTDGRKLMIW